MNEIVFSIMGVVAIAALLKAHESSKHIAFLSKQIEELKDKVVEIPILSAELEILRDKINRMNQIK